MISVTEVVWFLRGIFRVGAKLEYDGGTFDGNREASPVRGTIEDAAGCRMEVLLLNCWDRCGQSLLHH